MNGGAKADGADPVYSASYSLTQPDFTAQCLAAQQAGADVLFFAGDGDSLVRMARDCAAQNYKPLYMAASIAVNTAVQWDPLLNGLISTQSNFPWTDSYTPAQATYQQAMKTYAPNFAGLGVDRRRVGLGDAGAGRLPGSRRHADVGPVLPGLVGHQQQQPGRTGATTDLQHQRQRQINPNASSRWSCRTASSSTRTTGTTSAASVVAFV